MKDASLMDSDYLLYLLIYEAQYAMYRARRNELQEIGITPEESGVLFAIHFINTIGSETTPGEISRRIFREPHSVSSLINRMENKGLVRKAKDMDKKTMVRVLVTEEGQQAYEQSTKRETIHSIMSLLSQEERQQLGLCLEKLLTEALRKLRMGHKLPYLLSKQESHVEVSRYD